jgi:hypothetical protein
LNVGEYIVRVGGGIPGMKILLTAKEYLKLSTAGIRNHGPYYGRKWPGVVCPKLDWAIEKVS